jgi:hypothetical protein
MAHRDAVTIADASGAPVPHTPAFVTRTFDEELERLISELPKGKDLGNRDTLREARLASEEMIVRGWFNPV